MGIYESPQFKKEIQTVNCWNRVFQAMAQALKEVFLKVILYLLDVLSDWINGAEQITGLDIFTFFKDGEENVHLEITNISNFHTDCKSSMEGPTLGFITIGLSWLPGVIALIFSLPYFPLFAKSDNPKPLTLLQCGVLIGRFLAWPLFVPLHM